MSGMGQFSVRALVEHPADPSRHAEVDLIVDTGATLTWLPHDVVEQLGLPGLATRSFLLADGSTVERDTAAALLQVDGSRTAVAVAIAEAGEAALLGVTALESLGFGVDPIRQRLVPQTLLAL